MGTAFGNIKLASKVHLGVRSNIRVAKGTAISLLSGGQTGRCMLLY